MKKLVLFAALFISIFSYAQNNSGDKNLKIEIRSSNTEYEIHRKTNDHSSERIDLKKEDRKEHMHKLDFQRHNRPHLDSKGEEKPTKAELKKEHSIDKKHEHRHDKIQQRQERRENRGK